jgi:ribosomal protein S18 acetylase RimI-like enzyme
MPMRPLCLPQDLTPAADLLVRMFQYPEHPEWSVQSDEQDQVVDAIRRLRRIWPLVRGIQWVSPALRDAIRGFVWEEGGAVRAMVIAQREGTTSTWSIGTVGVLPECRRQGLARQLVMATLDMMRARGGARVRLNVIDGNLPAEALYESLGFTQYGGGARYMLTPAGTIDRPALPAAVVEERLGEFDWRARFELDRRIVPATLQEFEPLVPGRYRTPWLMRAFAPLFRLAQSSRDEDVILRRAKDRALVGRAGWSISKTHKGTNTIRVRLDPAQPRLAGYLVHRALNEVLTRSPSLRVELAVPTWMPDVAREAESLGFRLRMTGRSMGRTL